MPTLISIEKERTKKSFKKRDYRPWDLEGTKESPIGRSDDIVSTSQTPNTSSNYNDDIIENSIVELDPFIIKNWDYHDRPNNELGDIQELAKEFREIGQQQPCIVRSLNNDSSSLKYELIVGERRWEAAKLANIKLKVIIKDLSDLNAAIIQASENSSRKDLSDYAKGISYSKLISADIISQKELCEKLNINKQQISRLLSYNRIDKRIQDAISDMRNISSGTAEKIVQLSQKGEEYVEGIIMHSEGLKAGTIGHKKLSDLVLNYINISFSTSLSKEKVFSNNGKHLFTWRYDNNQLPSIHFPRDVLNTIKKESITCSIKEIVNELLIKENSPTGGTNN